MRKTKRHRQLAEINVVPYIDVMLVLLVIFMVTAPLLFQGVEVELPTAHTKPVDAKTEEPIIISVDIKGRLYLNIASKPTSFITATRLAHIIAQKLSGFPSKKPPVLIKGDKNLSYGTIIKIMAMLQRIGVSNIGLITQDETT